MKRAFRDFPIQRKMLLMTVAICGAVLLVAATVLFIFQVRNFRTSFERDTATLASIIANNSTAALAFNDRKAAAEILGSLKAKPAVLSARLVTRDMTPVAEFGRPESSTTQSLVFPPAGQFRFDNDDLLYTQPVELEKKILGYLHLRSDYHGVFLQLLGYQGLLMVGVFLASVLLSILLSGRLHRFITDPVLSLAETARIVGEKNDYSVRSSVAGHGDEIGVLAQAFNRMLGRIQSQDAALNLSQQKLEGLVNSIDGVVWEWDPTTYCFTYVSRQCEKYFGYPPERWIGDATFWMALVHPEDREFAARMYESVLEKHEPYNFEYRTVAANGRILWIRESGVVSVENDEPVVLRGIFQDITVQKHAAAELQDLNRQLVDASRQAGMAEVATGVLHNVGNVLNSANVSATLLRDRLNRSETVTLLKVASMIRENGSPSYFLDDPKGRLIPQFIVQIADQLRKEQEFFGSELEQLGRNVEHIKDIVATQQSYARMAGMMEKVSLVSLVEDALRINAASLTRANIDVIREFKNVPQIILDGHKVLQILINLIRNAKFAMEDSSERRLTVAIHLHKSDRVRVVVADTGCGIIEEHLTKIFSHGFTTRKDGHGFGLHIGALNAKQMGGSLAAASPGPGRGATFTLELPIDNQLDYNL